MFDLYPRELHASLFIQGHVVSMINKKWLLYSELKHSFQFWSNNGLDFGLEGLKTSICEL